MIIGCAQSCISIVPENWCDKIYYSASTIFLTIIALSAFYTHRIADDFLKAARTKCIIIKLNNSIFNSFYINFVNSLFYCIDVI